MANVGDLINGKYEIVSSLGEGGTSKVWLARDVSLNNALQSEKFWAVKEIKKKSTAQNGEVLLQGLIAEANLLTKLDHPMLPRIVDIQDDGVTIYVVMDYVPGDSLDKVLKRANHPMDEADVIDWGIQLCGVLEYLHSRKPRPVIYRDMKPSNIMWREDGILKLIDFGIAQEYKGGSGSDTVVGFTPDYAAPEQLDQTSRADQRTDIYNLGATLYHLVTGKNPAKPPFIKPIREWNPQLSEGLEHVIAKSTQRDPAKRYQTAEEMRYDLEHYKELSEDYRKGLRRKVNLFYGLGIGALVCLVIGIGCLVGSGLLRSSSYDYNMNAAALADTEEAPGGGASDAENYYQAAIGIEPANPEAYERLLGMYKADSYFTTTEADRWKRVFDEHQGLLQDSDSYGDICYDVGILYYLYYGYADKSMRTDLAVNWFDTARAVWEQQGVAGDESHRERYRTAGLYSTIAGFSTVIDQRAEEGGVQTASKEYWNSLDAAVRGLADEDAIIRLRMYEQVYDAANSPRYLGNFKSAGVTKDQVLDLLDFAHARAGELGSVVANTGNTAADLQLNLMNTYDDVRSVVQSVYTDNGNFPETTEGEE